MTEHAGRRALCVVIDGLGAGTEDGPDTLANVHRHGGGPHLPTLVDLGLHQIMNGVTVDREPRTGALWGLIETAYAGADTYLGHQEMMGTIPDTPGTDVLATIGNDLAAQLAQADLPAVWESTAPGAAVLRVGPVIVADNIEAGRGLNINVTASLDDLPFDELMHIGEVVRASVRSSRVIVVGGRGFDVSDILGHVRVHEEGHVGVDTPSLGVYDDDYRVRHLGFPVDHSKQVPSIARRAGLPVALIGKAADVVTCETPVLRDNAIPTVDVFSAVDTAMGLIDEGLIVANVQESDLAGHEQDPVRFAHVLTQVDSGIRDLLPNLGVDDLLVVTADHGNDPLSGSSHHTRELIPVLAWSPELTGGDLGLRQTLADVGASLAHWLGVELPPDGSSFLPVDGTEASPNSAEDGTPVQTGMAG